VHIGFLAMSLHKRFYDLVVSLGMVDKIATSPFNLGRTIRRTKLSTVYRAKSQPFVIKVLAPEAFGYTFEAVKLELSALRLASSLEHVVHLHQLWFDDDEIHLYFPAMGMDLQKYFALPDDQRPALSLLEKLQLATKFARGVAEFHARLNLVHRDLKPENILVDVQDGKVVNLKLCDLGHARQCVQSDSMITPLHETTTGWAGTLRYLSPEQARAFDASRTLPDYATFSTKISRRTDMFAVGLIMLHIFGDNQQEWWRFENEYESVTRGDQLPKACDEIRESCPELLCGAILALLRSDRDCRMNSGDLCSDLGRLLDDPQSLMVGPFSDPTGVPSDRCVRSHLVACLIWSRNRASGSVIGAKRGTPELAEVRSTLFLRSVLRPCLSSHGKSCRTASWGLRRCRQ
jgi:serine/threonine protein kinase